MLGEHLRERALWVVRKLASLWKLCEIKSVRDYFYSASLFFGVLLVIGMGPTLQIYFSGLLISQEANIYDSAYQDAIQKFPDLAEWVLYIINPQVIVSSIAVCWSALTSTRARIVLMRSFAAAVSSLTATDLIYLTVGGNFSIEEIFICVASNTAGGFLIAVIVVSMRSFAFQMASFEVNSRLATFAGFIIPALIGIAISGSVFIVAKTVYDPSPVSFSASVAPNSWGYYRPERVSSEVDRKNFEIFRDTRKNGRLKWTGMSMPLVVEWGSARSKYDMSLDLYVNCMRLYEGQQPQLPNTKPSLSLGAVRSVKVTLDEGMSEYELLSDGPANFGLEEHELSSFRVDAENGESVKFTMHPDGDAKLSISQDGQKKLFFSSFLIGRDKKSKPKLKERNFSFLVDGRSYRISFKPSTAIRKDAAAVCHPIRLDMSTGKALSKEISAVAVSAVLTLTPIKPEIEYLGDVEDGGSDIRSSGAGGWLVYEPTGTGVSNEDTFSDGVTDFLVISGEFESFQVEGAAMPTLSTNSLQAFGGSTEVSLTNGGVFHIKGKANALLWNNERVNKTRWEKMDIAERSLLLSWLVALLFLGYKGVRVALGLSQDLGKPI